MYKIDDYVMYKHDVCKIKDIKENKINGTIYYVMIPLDDDSLIIDVPTENRMGFLRDIISKKDAENLINNIPNIQPLDNIDDKNLENRYKELLNTGHHEDLIKIIKTTYIRNESRINSKKKISEKDENFFNLAEKYLYNELAIALNKSVEETKNYILEKCK